MAEIARNKKGITGSTLKIIAIVIMLIDHIGAILLEGIMTKNGLLEIIESGNEELILQFMTDYKTIYMVNMIMRSIGRIAFPIFAFLLIEGFVHTRNVRKYAFNLGGFALISEIPFNLAFLGNPWDISYQNIFFTLFIAVLVMSGLRAVDMRFRENKILNILLQGGICAVGIAAGALFRVDYGAFGVAVIVAMYLFRQRKMVSAMVGCTGLTIMMRSEIPCFLSLIPIKMYNGERGINMKYVFYLFYPGHILLLYAIGKIAGLI